MSSCANLLRQALTVNAVCRKNDYLKRVKEGTYYENPAYRERHEGSPMNVQELEALLTAKEGLVEFKEAKERFSFDELTDYCAALANESRPCRRPSRRVCIASWSKALLSDLDEERKPGISYCTGKIFWCDMRCNRRKNPGIPIFRLRSMKLGPSPSHSAIRR